MVTAGATREAIDPVRYISNHSTGKMGYAIAEVLAQRGAEVTLISGVTNLSIPKGVKRVDVVSAEEMYIAAREVFEHADGAVMCAAVADYTPATISETKIKKGDQSMDLKLCKTVDIAAQLGQIKGDKVFVGFALETDDEHNNAVSKLERKGFDFIVLNSLQDEGAGFGVDTNVVTLVDRETSTKLPKMSKTEVAEKIVDKIEKYA